MIDLAYRAALDQADHIINAFDSILVILEQMAMANDKRDKTIKVKGQYLLDFYCLCVEYAEELREILPPFCPSGENV